MVLGAWAAVGLAGASAGWAASPRVDAQADREVYAPAAEGRIRVVNDTKEPLFVPGCRPFELQVFAGDRYRSVPWKPCDREGTATKLPPGATEIPFTLPVSHVGAARAVLTWGRGCKEGLPLSQSACREFGAVTTRSFRVSRSPG